MKFTPEQQRLQDLWLDIRQACGICPQYRPQDIVCPYESIEKLISVLVDYHTGTIHELIYEKGYFRHLSKSTKRLCSQFHAGKLALIKSLAKEYITNSNYDN